MKKVFAIIVFTLNATILSAQNNESKSAEKQGLLIGAGIGGGVLLEKVSGLDMKDYGRYSLLNLKIG